MSILVNADTKVIVQGITGGQGRFYALRNRAYGTKVVGGVSPKKAGTDVEGIPVFASVADAVRETGATATMVIVPAAGAASAVIEAAEAGLELIVAVTEGIPVHDEARCVQPGRSRLPVVAHPRPELPGPADGRRMQHRLHSGRGRDSGGPVGIVSRSGTLTYQALSDLGQKGIGVTTCVGIGGDPVPGTSFIDCLSLFEADPDTKAVIMFGEIGGSAEEEAADFIRTKMSKPVVSYIAGVTAPPGKKMGHAGAIVSGSKGTAQAKMEALEAAGVRVATNPTAAGELMAEVVRGL